MFFHYSSQSFRLLTQNQILESLIYFTIFLIPFYSLRFSLLTIPTNLLEIFALITIFTFFFFRGSIQNLKNFLLPLFFVLCIFAGTIISSITYDITLKELGIIKGWIVVPFLFSLILLAKTHKQLIFKVFFTIFLSSSFVSIIAFIFKLFKAETYDGRITAWLSSPNELAMIIIPGIIISLISLTNDHLKKLIFPKNFPIFLLIFFASLQCIILFFTYSYLGWLSLILSFISYALFSKTLIFNKNNLYKYIFFVIIIFFTSFSQLQSEKFQNIFNERSSFSSRLMIYKSAFAIANDNLILGIGPGNFQEQYLNYQHLFSPYLEWAVPHPHNTFLAFWLFSGIIGLFGFITANIYIIYKLIYAIKKRPISLVPLTIFIYYFFHGILDTTAWRNDLFYMFYILYILSLALTVKNNNYKEIRFNLPSFRFTKNR